MTRWYSSEKCLTIARGLVNVASTSGNLIEIAVGIWRSDLLLQYAWKFQSPEPRSHGKAMGYRTVLPSSARNARSHQVRYRFFHAPRASHHSVGVCHIQIKFQCIAGIQFKSVFPYCEDITFNPPHIRFAHAFTILEISSHYPKILKN